MRGDRLNPESQNRAQQRGRGLSMGEILSLPARQRQIVNFTIRQKECRLAQIAEFLDESPAETEGELQELIRAGFVRESRIGGESVYTIELAAKKGSHLPDTIQQALTPGKPLATIVNPSGEVLLTPGSQFELYVTVSNKGNQSALIDIFIEETSEPVRQWCATPFTRLALGSGQSSEAIFKLDIPLDAVPGPYEYTLVVDAPQHYPEDTPILHSARVQVMPFVQEARKVSDPTFSLSPPTRSLDPAVLEPGQPLELHVLVHNRSDRVDRFRLDCPDLQRHWYSVIYPEGLAQPGIVTATEGLELNPGEKGEIVLLLQPPPDAWAGVYAPTVRLYSTNNPSLALLEPAYFRVAEIYLLHAEFHTVVGKIARGAGLFELRLTNMGNSPREVRVRAKGTDQEEICKFTIAPRQVRLLPGESRIVGLQVEPTDARRPFSGKLISFILELEDLDKFPLITDRFQGALMWEGRPWWQLLLLILAIASAIVGLAVLIWWLLTRPPVRPRIVRFAPESTTYKQANDDAIRLDWAIAHPEKIDSLTLIGLSEDGLVASGPVLYEFENGLPRSLQHFCKMNGQLVCENVWTDAKKAGKYIFELTLTPKEGEPGQGETLKTKPIAIEPLPVPKILEVASTRPVYQRQTRPDAPEPQGEPIALNWTIAHPEQLQAVAAIARSPDGAVTSPLKRYDFSQGIPEPLRGFCEIANEQLRCDNVPTDAGNPGDYIFELTAIPKHGEPETATSAKTEQIQVQVDPIPTAIAQFTLNGKPVPPKYLARLVNGDQPPVVLLSWKVTGDPDLQVQLLPSPGDVPPEGQLAYPLSPQPGSEVITLQASSPTGDPVTRSFVVETLPPPETVAVPPPPGADGAAEAPGGAEGEPGTVAVPPPPEEGTPGAVAGDGTSDGGPPGTDGTAAGEASGEQGAAGEDEGEAGSQPEEEPLPEPDPLEPQELPPTFN
ncbi:transcriptional regulator [Oxynema sp. CENA135]|nr:transcriptional regulator [Oxynema sp. CENA135]